MSDKNNTNLAKLPQFPRLLAKTHLLYDKVQLRSFFPKIIGNIDDLVACESDAVFSGKDKARERVNTLCLSRERNAVFVKNTTS